MFIKEITQTFTFNGKEVVLVIYSQSELKVRLFAVPVEVADRIKIDEYDGEEVERYSDIMDEIIDFEVTTDDSEKLPFIHMHYNE